MIYPSQRRIIGYVDRGLAAAIRRLEELGISEDVIARELEPVIDAGLELQTYVLLEGGTCWERSIPGHVFRQWLAQGGPLTPGGNPVTLHGLLQAVWWRGGYVGADQIAPCQPYFAGLADRERALSAELAAVNVPGWAEVLAAAADESRMADPAGGGFKLPWWLWVAGAYLIAREARTWRG